MNLKQSLRLLFVGLMVIPAVMSEGSKVADIRQKMASRTSCPRKYGDYINNCTTNYNNDIKQCEEEASAAKYKINEAYIKDHDDIVANTDSSCRALAECNNADDDDSNIYGCLAQRVSR